MGKISLLYSPTSPWPEFSLSVGGDRTQTHCGLFFVVLSSPAALLIGITLCLLGSTRKAIAMVTVSIRISELGEKGRRWSFAEACIQRQDFVTLWCVHYEFEL